MSNLCKIKPKSSLLCILSYVIWFSNVLYQFALNVEAIQHNIVPYVRSVCMLVRFMYGVSSWSSLLHFVWNIHKRIITEDPAERRAEQPKLVAKYRIDMNYILLIHFPSYSQLMPVKVLSWAFGLSWCAWYPFACMFIGQMWNVCVYLRMNANPDENKVPVYFM